MPEKKFQRVVVETLLEICDELKSLNQQGDIEDEGEQIRQLPLRTLEEAQRMSLEISRHPSIKRLLIKQLSHLGGKDIKTCTRRILDRILHNDVQRKYNLLGGGRQGKKGFKKTAFFTVVLESVRINFPTATEDLVAASIGDHLKQAPARCGGRGTTTTPPC
ncbi:uncharacterized protein LOC111841793 [Xyrichtys novacula]|uniref:Uncharacterized protein LOC111841793 n=1 Tax=Xyrichtys novacula TaxID=13765 RepID=A0AAV1EQG5_XYRNO|nr:uncharacterized protein LOC111841793 [Xyrichtys novacula]